MNVRLLFALSAAAAVSITWAGQSADASPHCHHVHATITTTVTQVGCTSPVGLCTTGSIDDSDALSGSTTFSTLGLAASAGLPGVEPATTLSYSGALQITAEHGTLLVRDVGILEQEHAVFTEIDRVISGTGRFS